MKISILVPNRNGGRFAANLSHSSITGQKQSGSMSPEDDLVLSIDESNMTAEKLAATRFLNFLSTRKLNIDSLAMLPRAEQERIKEEFTG